jgi:hypothetical protein
MGNQGLSCWDDEWPKFFAKTFLLQRFLVIIVFIVAVCQTSKVMPGKIYWCSFRTLAGTHVLCLLIR